MGESTSNSSQNVSNNASQSDELSRKATLLVFKFVVDLFKIVIQAFLVGFVITPFIFDKYREDIFVIGFLTCLYCAIIAGIIEYARGKRGGV